MGTFAFSFAGTARVLAVVAVVPAAVVRSAWGAYRRSQERRRSLVHLQSLDDAFLKDIGLHRSEITSVVYHGRKDGSRRQR